MDLSPLIISLKTGILVTILSFFTGILTAWKVYDADSRIKCFIDSLLTLPMVIPPTAAGFILLLVFSTRRSAGAFLLNTFNIKVIQSWLGCIIAAFVIAFPLMYRNARAAFEQVDRDIVYAARTLGMSEISILVRVVIPAAVPGLVSGSVLTFARAMGEYGATSMLAGNISGKTATISQKIAMVVQDGNYAAAGFWVVVVILTAFTAIVVMNVILSRLMRK